MSVSVEMSSHPLAGTVLLRPPPERSCETLPTASHSDVVWEVLDAAVFVALPFQAPL